MSRARYKKTGLLKKYLKKKMDASKRKYMEAFVFFSTILCHEKQFQKGDVFLRHPLMILSRIPIRLKQSPPLLHGCCSCV